MAIDVDYPQLLRNFQEHIDPKRSESAAFLIWYLEQYYRLDPVDAVDAVCDQSGDKGVDGIFINDNDLTITIFQSKISHKTNTAVGDAALRDFLGTLEQFSSVEAATHLMNTAGNAQVANLIRHSGLLTKLDSHQIQGEFVTNIDIDNNGAAFLQHHGDRISFVGKSKLIGNYISDERDLPQQKPAIFDIFGIRYAEHIVDGDRKAVIAPIKARELVQLDGIEDQSLFAYNVRGPLGRTSVNRDLVKSINDQHLHKIFPLFHNGVTVIAKRIDVADDKIKVSDYYVVNGCQSITSLHGHRDVVTDDLKLLTKFIQMDPASEEAKMITEFSNNQNGVRSRDFKSNSQTQIRLRTEFVQHYKGLYSYEIKRGETGGQGEPISNEEAGLYLMAFDYREPWGTFRKYEVFEDKHTALFARPEVSADRIVLLRVVDEEIVEQLPKLKEQLLAKYSLTKYMIMYILRELFSDDKTFEEILANAPEYMRNAVQRHRFRKVISGFIGNIIIDINIESGDFGPEFDYRRALKDADWVRGLTRNIKRDFQKSILREKQDTFEAEWKRSALA
ncbi:AIPR family protein [Methylobacterium sp. E-046]|uniref:AIPR family protein n=1 Tax=Methylobacterium sp. E-046 TaxID=2836576 RepID=UPI001FBB0970|nr:AIPR family protein [Methylobacterium sp. E-046]MCJ2102404.1 AIPR family protein [Methylobacterium sp. E-046]